MHKSIGHILRSEKAFSVGVWVGQIPATLAISFSARMQTVHQHPAIALLIGLAFMLGLAIVLGLANLIRRHPKFPDKFLPSFTLLTWLTCGFVEVAITSGFHTLLGGSQYPFLFRMIFIPIFSLTGLLIITSISDRAGRYRNKFRELQADAEVLRKLQNESVAQLRVDRKKLVESIFENIEPELTEIRTQVTKFSSADSAPQALEALSEKIDSFSLDVLRPIISDLENAQISQLPPDSEQLIVGAPKLKWSELSLAPWRSFRIAILVTFVANLLTISGVTGPPTKYLVYSILSLVPIFIVSFISKYKRPFTNVPPVFWVCLASIIVFTLRLKLGDNNLINNFATNGESDFEQMKSVSTAVTALVCASAVSLGSIEKYFQVEYVTATNEQIKVNEALSAEISRISKSRTQTRRDLARLLHGPIQGRIAALRMKLHLMAETENGALGKISEKDLEQITQLLQQVNFDLFELTKIDLNLNPIDVRLSLIDLVAQWSGIVNVSFEFDGAAETEISNQISLGERIVACCAEAITNSSRHAHATQIIMRIRLTSDFEKIRVTVHDNGTPNYRPITPGIGLKDISADGGDWQLVPQQTGNLLQVDYLISTQKVVTRLESGASGFLLQ